MTPLNIKLLKFENENTMLEKHKTYLENELREKDAQLLRVSLSFSLSLSRLPHKIFNFYLLKDSPPELYMISIMLMLILSHLILGAVGCRERSRRGQHSAQNCAGKSNFG